MPRIHIDLPREFPFSTSIPIRITDLNYGNHVGNDTILSILHEARIQFLASAGYTEMAFAGVGMIMSDVAINFKAELFYGDPLTASVAAGNFTRVGFDLYYKLETRRAGGEVPVKVAEAKTGMVCYDYVNKKIVAVPEEARLKLPASAG